MITFFLFRARFPKRHHRAWPPPACLLLDDDFVRGFKFSENGKDVRRIHRSLAVKQGIDKGEAKRLRPARLMIAPATLGICQ